MNTRCCGWGLLAGVLLTLTGCATVPHERTTAMRQEVLFTEAAPRPIGPYAQAVRAGEFLFLSGQIPLDPATGELVTGDVETQTRRVLDNMRAVLQAAGSGMDRVVKTTIFLQSMDDFPKVNAVYAEYFPATPPARSTVEVSRLPKSVAVEIEAIALAGGN